MNHSNSPAPIGTLTAACAALLFAAAPAAGQEAQLGVYAGRAVDELGRSHGAVTLSPSLGWTDARSAFRVGGQASLFETGGLFGAVGAEARSTVGSAGPFAAGVEATGWLAASDAGYRSASGSVRPLARLSGAGWGVDAGPRFRVGREQAVAGAPEARGLLPVPGAGDATPAAPWRQQRALEVGGWARQGWLRLRVDWQAAAAEGLRWREWGSEVAVETGAAAVTLRSGARTGEVEERWISGSAAWWLTPNAGLLAEAGRTPSDPLTRRPGGNYAGVGLALRTAGGTLRGGPSGPVPVRLGEGGRLTVRATPGARVEILGDWTDWRPEEAREVAPGVYAVQVELEPGVYRFSLRVDGRWDVPPGYETEPDGFGGRRAVLRVVEASAG